MTNEELEKAIIEVKAEISKFGPDEGLSRQDRRLRWDFLEQYDILEKIKKARAASNVSREGKMLAYYDLLIHGKDMNPVLKHILKIRLKSGIWV
jgi:hypothetical protein